jgi:hypothetical protein
MIFDIDLPQALTFAIGVILPLLVGLVTRWNAAAGVRAVLLLALSAVTSLLTELLDALNTGTPFELGPMLLAAFGAFLIGVGTHFGLWAPTGAAAAVKHTGGFIGGSPRSTYGDGGTVAP